MHGSEMVNAHDVSKKHSSKSDNADIPLHAQFIFFRPLVYLVALTVVAWILSFKAGFVPKQDRAFESHISEAGFTWEGPRNILFSDDTLVQHVVSDEANPQSKEFHVQLDPVRYSANTPFPVDSDACLVRIINTCDSTERAGISCGMPQISSRVWQLVARKWQDGYEIFST